jgi:hypothetical protein
MEPGVDQQCTIGPAAGVVVGSTLKTRPISNTASNDQITAPFIPVPDTAGTPFSDKSFCSKIFSLS